jgi:hypothetical protein
MSLTYVAKGQTCGGPNGWKVRGRVGILKARMAGVQHTTVSWNAGWKSQVLPVPVEIMLVLSVWSGSSEGPFRRSQRNGKLQSYVCPKGQAPE